MQKNSLAGELRVSWQSLRCLPQWLGCEGVLLASTAERVGAGHSKARVAIDAGVVFSERENYLCAGFDRLGLTDGVVSSVASSCECVQPSIVAHRSPQGRDANAVLFRLAKAKRNSSRNTEIKGSSDAVASSVSLGGLAGVKLADEAVRQFTVNLLHASLAQEVVP